MYVGQDFPPNDVGENQTYSFDFQNDLVEGETITSVVWTCSAVSGFDANANDHLIGDPVITDAIVSHRVDGLLLGVKYRLRAVATTSLGNVKSLWSRVYCSGPRG